MSDKSDQLNLAGALRQHLESLRDMGVSHLPKARESDTSSWIESLTGLAPVATPAESPQPAGRKPGTPANRPNSGTAVSAPSAPKLPGLDDNARPYGPELPVAERQTELQILSEKVAGCTRCDELCSNRTQTVFGVGTPTPRLVFFGEGPGADEDRLGEPFVGKAGQLLNKIINAMKLSREEVYILNTVKCRPPGNRNPSETEIANCMPFAERQLEILQPEFICCLGSIAARSLLRTQLSIGRMRGQFYNFRSSRVIVTYHPAYLLRTPSAKQQVWDDMKMLMAELNIEI